MSAFGSIRAGVRRLFRIPLHREQLVYDDADLELDAFMAARVDALVARGMTREQALAEALRRLGTSVEDARTLLHRSANQRERRMSLRDRFDALVHDLRYAMRGLRARPGFSLAVMVTLGLGIGANTAMFSIVDRLLFRPPAYLRDADAVHRIYFGRTFDGTEQITRNFGYRTYMELRDWSSSFDRTATFFVDDQTPVGEGADARPRPVAGVSASFFQFFDATPALGRWFGPVEDSTPAGTAVAVLGYPYWQSQFGGADDVLGKTVHIGPLMYTVVGVAPKEFTGLSVQAPVAFIPITSMGATANGPTPSTMYFKTYNMRWVEMIAHRRAGVTPAAATTDLTTAYRRSYAVQREENPQRTLPIESVKPRAFVAPVLAERGPNPRSDSRVATWLIGVTAIVLLVACANVANLLLARALGRRREIAVRLALGVSRARLVSQLLTESLVLAVCGGVLGLLIAQTGGSVLRSLFLPSASWTLAATDGRTLAFTAAIVLLTGVLAGIAPALHARKSDVAESLKSGVREGTYHRSRMRSALMVAQGALSVVLLVGAGLFVRSLQQVHGVRLGFDPDRLIYIAEDMRGTRLDTLAMAALKTRLLERAATLPGVEHAARAVTVPFWRTINMDLYVPGIDSTGRFGEFDMQAGSADYFATAGTRLLRGRGIEATDVTGGPLVIVVSEPMAHALWPGQDAIGKCVKLNEDTMPCRTVVGIAEEVRSDLGTDNVFHYYIPISQWRSAGGGLYVRIPDAERRVESIRRELQKLMPGDSYLQATPVKQVFDPAVRSWRLGATLFVAFGGLALVLATLGLYSVIAYSVAQRSQELGVRIALGALGRDVLRLVLRQGLRLAAGGVVLGGAIALWAGQFVKPLLYQVSPRDPMVFVLVIASLLVAALVASLIPALRATRVDPISALRSD